MSSESQPPRRATPTRRKPAVCDVPAGNGNGAGAPGSSGGVVIDRRERAFWRAAASVGVPRDPYFALALDTLNS